MRASRRHTAARLQRFALNGINQFAAKALARTQRLHQLFREITHVNHDALDANRDQFFDVIFDQRHAAHGHQRLAQRVGQGSHTLAATGGQNHRSRGFSLAASHLWERSHRHCY